MATPPAAARIARRQHGLVTRAQLLELGLSQKQIAGWTRNGRLERLLPGVFRFAGAPATKEQSLSAAVLWAGSDALVSHRSAGELWDFDGVTANKPEVTVPLAVRKRTTAVVVHQTRSQLRDRRTRRGVPATTPERTLIDLAGVLSAQQLEVAFESARRERQVTAASIDRTLVRLGARGRAGTEPLQFLLATLADEPPCESPLEVLAARMLRSSSLPRPERQVPVTAFGNDYRLDFAWRVERVALECDGRKWHEIEADFERDRQRWSAITAATGYRIVWATWRRIEESPARVRAELRELLLDGAADRTVDETAREGHQMATVRIPMLGQAAGEFPSPRGRGRRPRAERFVGNGMTLSTAPTTVNRDCAPCDDDSALAPTRADADG